MALVFFDLDGTLIKGLSSETRFFVCLLRGRIMRLRLLAAFLIFTLRCFTPSPPGIHPLGAAKLQIAEQRCRIFNTTLAKCTAYANSASDIALLASMSQAVAVYPDSKLRQIAERRGWEIIG